MSLNRKICVIAANNSLTENNETLDYIQLASICAERVIYYLGLPTVLITSDVDTAKKYKIFSQVIFQQPKKVTKRHIRSENNQINYKWFNDSRIDAFELTKGLADKILMIDADYIIASDQLLSWLNNDYSFQIFNRAYDLTGKGVFDNRYLGSRDLIQRWATAICWDQSDEARLVFEVAKMVRDNYDFYSLMLDTPAAPFRNDVAFSVACHLLNVPTNDNYKLYNLLPSHTIKYVDSIKEWLVFFDDKCIRWYHDIHVLNKNYAIDPNLMKQLRLKNVTA
jgi:hypothetical protein